MLFECQLGKVVGSLVMLDISRVGKASVNVLLRGMAFGPGKLNGRWPAIRYERVEVEPCIAVWSSKVADRCVVVSHEVIK